MVSPAVTFVSVDRGWGGGGYDTVSVVPLFFKNQAGKRAWQMYD